jgi:peptide/nickel transport system permease protein
VLPYILRRLLLLVPMLLGITAVSFAAIQLAPGDFLDEMRLNPVISGETVERMKRDFGLDQPPHVQYLRWLWNVVRGDFGYSFAYQVPVAWLLGSRWLNTVILNLAAFAVSWTVAIPLGIHAAVRQYSWSDHVLTFASLLGISTPTFFTGLLGLYVAFRTGWVPIGGMTSLGYEDLSPAGKVLDVAHHLILPTLILGFGGVAGLMRQMRGNLLEVLRQEYVKTARAKGLGERTVLYKHAVRNAINPLITIFGFQLGGLLSGSAILENVIGWPGIGQLIVEAIFKKDLYVVMASLVVGSVTLVLGNLVADVLLAAVDPRIRYD